jgi:hypothetical protein
VLSRLRQYWHERKVISGMERNCLGHHLHIARAAASDGVLRFEGDSLPRDMGRTAHRRQPTRAPFVRSIAELFDVYLSRESDKPRHCARSSEGSNRGERLVLLAAPSAGFRLSAV